MQLTTGRLIAVACGVLMGVGVARAQQTAALDPNRWEPTIQKFEDAARYAARYAARVVLPHAPRVLVLYPGENDIARGVKADAIGASFQQLYGTVHTALPQTRFVVIGLKPTPVRWQFDDEMRRANALIQGYCKTQAACVYVDVRPDMLGADGKPKPELYVADGEHMTPEGYKIWARLIRPVLQVEGRK